MGHPDYYWLGREFAHSDRAPITIRRFVFIHSGMHGPMAATDVYGEVVWRRSYESFGGDGLFASPTRPYCRGLFYLGRYGDKIFV